MNKPEVSLTFPPFKADSAEPHEVTMCASNGAVVEVGTGADDTAALSDLARRLEARGESEYAATVRRLFVAARQDGGS